MPCSPESPCSAGRDFWQHPIGEMQYLLPAIDIAHVLAACIDRASAPGRRARPRCHKCPSRQYQRHLHEGQVRGLRRAAGVGDASGKRRSGSPQASIDGYLAALGEPANLLGRAARAASPCHSFERCSDRRLAVTNAGSRVTKPFDAEVDHRCLGPFDVDRAP
jgi:hypothetical protein